MFSGLGMILTVDAGLWNDCDNLMRRLKEQCGGDETGSKGWWLVGVAFWVN